MSRLLAVLFLLAACGSSTSPPAPQTLYVNGKVWTADPSQPHADALLVQGERLVAVGTTAELERRTHANTTRVDLGGRAVIPGLVDAHTHVAPLGSPTWFVNDASFVPGAGPSAQEMAQLVAARAAQVPDGTPILGLVGPGFYASQGSSPRDLLDGATTRHPVVLVDWSGHGMVCNSAGLALAGYVDGQPHPYSGRLERDAAGRLTGNVRELAEVPVFQALSTLLPTEAYAGAYTAYGQAGLRWGLTTIFDIPFVIDGARADAVITAQTSKAEFIPICLVDAPGKVCPPGPDGVIRRKVFADGGPNDCGTLVSVPYLAPETCPPPASFDWRGFQDVSASELDAVLADVRARGGQLLVHALGDAAVSTLLDRLEALGGEWAGSVTLEHGDLMRPADVERVRRQGITVVQNPLHLALVPTISTPRVEQSILEHAEPLRSLLTAGIPLAFGADSFQSPNNPWAELQMAVTHPIYPGEAITLEQALMAYTRGSAEARLLKDVGVLREGALATFAVLSQDVFTVPVEDLPSTTSVLTVVDGQVAWSDGALAPPAAP